MAAFTETLRRVVDRVEGARAVSLVGADGIPVETWGRQKGFRSRALQRR
jgi:hypothetical protein